jgi:hypothetical protein
MMKTKYWGVELIILGESSSGCRTYSLELSYRFIHIPACIIVGLMGLMVDIPLYTAIAVVKSPYMLFKGWFRLVHDVITREGPFLETACIPIAGLTILLWPLVVMASILMAVFSSIFVGLYASVIVYQVCLYFSIILFVQTLAS